MSKLIITRYSTNAIKGEIQRSAEEYSFDLIKGSYNIEDFYFDIVEIYENYAILNLKFRGLDYFNLNNGFHQYVFKGKSFPVSIVDSLAGSSNRYSFELSFN